jgi:hypothetical protein
VPKPEKEEEVGSPDGCEICNDALRAEAMVEDVRICVGFL